MTRKERHRLEMLQRVGDFGAAHHELFPESSEGGQAFAAVAAAADAIKGNAVKKLLTAKDGQEALAVARALVIDRMRVIARTAKGMLRIATSDPKLRMPKLVSTTALVTAANAFVTDAEAEKDRLIRLGMPATAISDLREAAAALEQASVERADGRAQAKGAQDSIEETLAGTVAALRVLDAVVFNATRQTPALLAEWQTHRRVAGVRRSPEAAAPAEADAADKKAS